MVSERARGKYGRVWAPKGLPWGLQTLVTGLGPQGIRTPDLVPSLDPQLTRWR